MNKSEDDLLLKYIEKYNKSMELLIKISDLIESNPLVKEYRYEESLKKSLESINGK